MESTLYQRITKPLLDRLLAGLLLVLTAPLLAVVALLVRLNLGAPVLFRQRRPGQGGVPFSLYKFRTMRQAYDQTGELLPDHQRLTRLGRVLRASSLDELPALWNVLRGEMSLVGPRPLLMQYLERYTPRQARRHEAKPGITGWAQVNGRNALDWESKFELDVWYVDHGSLALDVKILLRTAAAVLRFGDTKAPGHETMPEFLGSQPAPDVQPAGGVDGSGERLPVVEPSRAASVEDQRRFLASVNVERHPAADPSRQVMVIGAGGHGKVVVSTLQAAGYCVIGVYDDDATKWGHRLLGVPIRGPISELDLLCGAPAVIAIGDNNTRRRLAARLHLRWLQVVHPRAWVHDSVTLGEGAVVMAGAIVQPGSRIGAHAIVNTGATVDHDCWLGDFAHVGPGVHLAGSVRVLARTDICTGSNVIPGVTIGEASTVGAGATVIRDLPGGVVAVGCPAVILRMRHRAKAA